MDSSLRLRKIPVTVVTGLLGSGKTTLIRHVLTHTQGRRIAVVVNEFGAIGFDGALIRAACGDLTEGQSTAPSCSDVEVLELADGCICCKLAEDFLPTMEVLLARVPTPEQIVIETSGLALPQPLLQAFQWPSMRARLCLDGVVTVVDAQNRQSFSQAGEIPREMPGQEHEKSLRELLEEQLSCADLVLLNKTEQMSAEMIAAAIDSVQASLRPGVEILPIQRGCVAPMAVFGLTPLAESAEGPSPRVQDHFHAEHGEEEAHGHDHAHLSFETRVLRGIKAPSLAHLRDAVQSVLCLPGVLRVKGKGRVVDKPHPALVQGVGRHAEVWFAPTFPGETALEREEGLVVIGLQGCAFDKVAALLSSPFSKVTLSEA